MKVSILYLSYMKMMLIGQNYTSNDSSRLWWLFTYTTTFENSNNLKSCTFYANLYESGENGGNLVKNDAKSQCLDGFVRELYIVCVSIPVSSQFTTNKNTKTQKQTQTCYHSKQSPCSYSLPLSSKQLNLMATCWVQGACDNLEVNIFCPYCAFQHCHSHVWS